MVITVAACRLLCSVPITIAYAQCIPVCGSRYPGGGGAGPEAEALEAFETNTIAAGCKLDGQSGTTTDLPGYTVDLGTITEIGGAAVPACVSASLLNLNNSGSAGVPPGLIAGGMTAMPAPPSSPGGDIVEEGSGDSADASTSTPAPPPVPPAPPLQAAPSLPSDLSAEQLRRRKLANQVAGLVMTFYEVR